MEDEVRHTENYLELMKDRYEENLIYNIEEAGELERVKVPRVILQPLWRIASNMDSAKMVFHGLYMWQSLQVMDIGESM